MKTVIINRAVPGSDKKTFAKNIFAAMVSVALSIAVPDPARYFNYRCDEHFQDVVCVPNPVKPFDYATLIQLPIRNLPPTDGQDQGRDSEHHEFHRLNPQALI